MREPLSCLVTGGSRGVGAAVSLRLASRGDLVVAGCREKRARVARLSDRAVEAGGIAIESVVGDLTDAETLPNLVHRARGANGRIDVLVLSASGGLERGKGEEFALGLNRDAQLSLVIQALDWMRAGGTIVYVTSHQAHFSAVVQPEEDYAVVARSKRAGEDALRELNSEFESRSIRLLTVSADVIVDSATTLLMERTSPGATERRRKEVGWLPTTDIVAEAIVTAIDGDAAHNHIDYVGGAEWFWREAAGGGSS